MTAETFAPDGTADVSVIVPAFEAADTLDRALKSIAAQTLRPREVFVIDDGSRDGTWDVANRANAELDVLAIAALQQPHEGAGAARNRGVANATGKYVAFLDADDEWLPEKLEHSLEMIRRQRLSFFCHEVTIFEEDGRRRVTDCVGSRERDDDAFVAQFLRGFVATSTVVVERALILNAGGFDPSLPSGQDYDLWLGILALADTRIGVSPEVLTNYFSRPNSISSRVELRRQCAMRIAGARAGQLAERMAAPGRILFSRTVIIQFQAITGHISRGNYLAALLTAFGAPFRILSARVAIGRSRKAEPETLSYAYAAPTGHSGSGVKTGSDDPANPFLRTRRAVEATVEDSKERNRQWWEKLPMSYADWSDDDRVARDAKQFEEIEAYALANSPYFRNLYDFHAHRGERVLDLGCGSGVFSCLLAISGAAVTSVDLTDAAVNMTQLNARTQGADVSVVRGDAENLPLAPDQFDYVFSWGVLHHTPDMPAAFREVRRVLKTGGTAMIMVYHRHSWVYVGHGLYWLLLRGKIFQGHGLRSVQDVYTDGFYHRYLSRRELSELVMEVGMSPERTFVTQYQKKIIPGIPRFLDRWMKARFGMCVAVELRKTG